MIEVVAAFGALILGLSIWGAVQPAALFRMIKGMTDGPFMIIAVGTRVVLAIVLWFAAPESRHPIVFQVLAVLALLAAFGLLIMGKTRAVKLLDWFAEKSDAFKRLWLLLGIGFGGYLLWAVWPALTRSAT